MPPGRMGTHARIDRFEDDAARAARHASGPLANESRREICAESMLPEEAKPAVELANITARAAAKHAC